MTVNIIYDEAVFLTKEEAGRDVQQIIEAPDVYIFGRSTDSIADKLSFIETRAEDIASLDQNIKSVDGVSYADYFRFFSGDHPEQEFEAGQSEGGNYPCVNCDASAHKFDDFVHCARSTHRTLNQRVHRVSIF